MKEVENETDKEKLKYGPGWGGRGRGRGRVDSVSVEDVSICIQEGNHISVLPVSISVCLSRTQLHGRRHQMTYIHHMLAYNTSRHIEETHLHMRLNRTFRTFQKTHQQKRGGAQTQGDEAR